MQDASHLITDAMAREIVMGKDGKAEAVAPSTRKRKLEQRVRARRLLGVSSERVWSARLLLNSKSTHYRMASPAPQEQLEGT